jgi:ADP-heptose:LPS heptosyltransferase
MDRIALSARRQVEEKFSLKNSLELELKAYEEVLCRKSILIIKISSLGDVILSVPSLRAVRKKYPRAVIKVMVDVRFSGILKECPYIDDVIVCDFKVRDKGMSFFKFVERVRSEDFDRKVNPPKDKLSPVEHQAQVLALTGITKVEDRLELWSRSEDEEWVENFLRSGWFKKGQKLVAISISSSKRWETKNWNVSRMAELADMLASEKGVRVVAIGLEEDIERAEEFFRKTSAKPLNAVGKTDIGKLISLIKRCDALLTGDSAPMHIASAVGTPFVAIFGPTDPRRHISSFGKKKILKKELRCSPCYKTYCHRHLKCMNAIKTREVFDSLMEFLFFDNEGHEADESADSSYASQ